jgi:hypothetical protein
MSPAELLREVNNGFVGCDLSVKERKLFPAPSLNTVNRDVILSVIPSTKSKCVDTATANLNDCFCCASCCHLK